MNSFALITQALVGEITLVVGALLALLACAFLNNQKTTQTKVSYYITQTTLLVVIIAIALQYFHSTSFNLPSANKVVLGVALHNPFGDLLKLALCLMVLAINTSCQHLLLEANRVDKAEKAPKSVWASESFVITLLALLGAFVAVSAVHLLTLFVGLELMALALYGLLALERTNTPSIKAAIKYFVLGSLASGVMLFGMSFIYGAVGRLDLPTIAQATYQISLAQYQHQLFSNSVVELVGSVDTLLVMGLILMVVGIAFKLSCAPLHFWVADVYHDGNTPSVGLIASISKVVVVILLFRVLFMAFGTHLDVWQPWLIGFALFSLAIGNLAAIAQKSLKRMLAYSGVSHAGFMILGLAMGGIDGAGASIFYALVYGLTSALAFGLLSILSTLNNPIVAIDDIKGLSSRNPLIAFMLLILLFSMAGVPPMVGFFAKFGILKALIDQGWIWLAVYAVLFSVVGAFYYLRVVKVMYFDSSDTNDKVKLKPDTFVIFGVLIGLIIITGLVVNGPIAIVPALILFQDIGSLVVLG